jgi:hypothetical protein
MEGKKGESKGKEKAQNVSVQCEKKILNFKSHTKKSVYNSKEWLSERLGERSERKKLKVEKAAKKRVREKQFLLRSVIIEVFSSDKRIKTRKKETFFVSAFLLHPKHFSFNALLNILGGNYGGKKG